MDERLLEVIRELVSSRNQFFSRAHIFYGNRDELARQIFEEEKNIIDIIRTIYRNQRAVPITFSIPLSWAGAGGTFDEPVPVFPTPDQITNELVQLAPSSSPSVCSICQDTISSDGCQLRGCAHTYHTSCIRMWFSTSVRCPVCRRDIREDQEDQTFSGSQ